MVFSIGKGAALTKSQNDKRVQQDMLLFLENGVLKQKLKKPEKDYWYPCIVEKQTTLWITYFFINFTKR